MRALALLLALTAPVCSQVRSGDTHTHFQACQGPDLTLQEVQEQVSLAGLDFAAVQVWAKWADLPEYLSYAPLVTGTDAASGIRYGVEVSGFLASQFGHLTILQAQDGNLPVFAQHSGPIFSYYDAALCGYAHVVWALDYAPVPFYGGVGGVYTAPIDAALGHADFIETINIEKPNTSWRGLYYKLQNAGIRIGLAAGSDSTCVGLVGQPRTLAVAETFDEWCNAIRAGRVTIAANADTAVSVLVNDVGPGEYTIGPLASVEVTATGPVEVLRNGQVIGTTNDTYVIPASSWVSARTPGAETAAVYVIVDDEPIVLAQDAQYWVDYCNAFIANIGVFNVPAAEAEIITRITAARAIYSAMRTRALPWPSYASEYGLSTTACEGPISIGLTGNGVDCVNAPPLATGYLMIGHAPVTISTNGITLLVSPSLPYTLVPVASTSGGYCKVPLSIPSGKHFYAQFIWTKGCPGALAASDALDVVMP